MTLNLTLADLYSARVGRRVISTLLLLAALGHAQETSYQLEQFEPRPGGAGILSVSTPASLPPLGVALDVWMGYQSAPLVLEPVDPDDPRDSGELVADRGRLELVAGLGVLPGIQIGGSASFARSFNAGSYSAGTDLGEWVPADPRLHLDVAPLRLIGLDSLLGLSVGANLTAWLPFGDEDAFEGEGRLRLEPRVTAQYALLGFKVAADFGYHWRGDQRVAGLSVGDVFRWGVAADVPLVLGLGVRAAAFGAVHRKATLETTQDQADQNVDPSTDPAEAQLAARWQLPLYLEALVGTGRGLTAAPGSPRWRLFAKLGVAPREEDALPALAGPDADGDGVPDGPDVCPYEPENRDGVRDEDGCPEGPRREVAQVPAPPPPPLAALVQPEDKDGDGIVGDADACPEEPEDKDGYADEDGCPDLDDDRDGLADADDRCPQAAEIYNGVTDEDGCPDTGPDADGDGVEDALDVCPLEAETANGLRDGDGCPESGPLDAYALVPAATPATEPPPMAPPPPMGDLDGDGIPDHADACRDEPEDKDGFADGDGCPDPDDDGDQVPDELDRCPQAAEIYNGVADADGCPDLGPDADGDGVEDELDVCPLEAETANGLRDGDGCPEGGGGLLSSVGSAVAVASGEDPPELRPLPLADVDGDGLWGDDDDCPREAEDKDGFEDGDGCPEPDDDGDSIPDAEDRCPRAAEVPNDYRDGDGCPDVLPKDLRRAVGPVKLKFKGEALRLADKKKLRWAVVALRRRTGLGLEIGVDVAGEDRRAAIQVAKARAVAVRDYLLKAKIDPERVRARGYGPDRDRGDGVVLSWFAVKKDGR